MRAAILGGSSPYGLPIDPDAYDATELGRQYLHEGRDDEVLDALLERDCSHPAYRLALDWVVCGLLATGADVPVRLRRWNEEPRKAKERAKRRWRSETVQNHLLGVVVEMMVTGTSVLEEFREGETEKEQLQHDLRATSAETGKPIEELPTDEVLERVNKRRSRRRGNADARRPLTEDELVELIRGLSTRVSAGSHMISPPTDYDWKDAPSFPNLHWMSGEATKDSADRTYSICDAVAEVLQEELPRQVAVKNAIDRGVEPSKGRG